MFIPSRKCLLFLIILYFSAFFNVQISDSVPGTGKQGIRPPDHSLGGQLSPYKKQRYGPCYWGCTAKPERASLYRKIPDVLRTYPHGHPAAPMIWCGRRDLNPYAGAKASKTFVSAIPPRPQKKRTAFTIPQAGAKSQCVQQKLPVLKPSPRPDTQQADSQTEERCHRPGTDHRQPAGTVGDSGVAIGGEGAAHVGERVQEP